MSGGSETVDDAEADRLAMAFFDGYDGDRNTVSWWTLTTEQQARFRAGVRSVLAAQTRCAEAERMRDRIVRIVADLRHAYSHLAANRVVRQQELARGLIGPSIERLERLCVSDENPTGRDAQRLGGEALPARPA